MTASTGDDSLAGSICTTVAVRWVKLQPIALAAAGDKRAGARSEPERTGMGPPRTPCDTTWFNSSG
jgi:hypothetical protein